MRNRIEDMLQSNQRQVNLILLGTLQSSAVTCMHALPNWYYTPTAPRTCVEYIVHLCTIHSMLPNCTQEADSLPFWGTGLLPTILTMWLVALWSLRNAEKLKYSKFSLMKCPPPSRLLIVSEKKYGEAVIRLYGLGVGYILAANRCNRTYFLPLSTRFLRQHNALLSIGNI